MDVEKLYAAFIKDLRKNSKDLSRLQCFGKMEDYLVKRFALLVEEQSSSSKIPLINFGGPKRRYDVVLASQKGLTHEAYTHIFEFKYLRNRHGSSKYEATDEVSTALDSLQEQMKNVPAFLKKKRVALSGKNKQIYGIVVASYVHLPGHGDGDLAKKDAKTFLHFVETRLKDRGFCYTDLTVLQRRSAYLNKNVTIGISKGTASLYAYLVRLPGSKAQTNQKKKAA